ncbi:MAG: hypothetical protein WC779_03680 [Candidatus Omnitrophota bacterium]|jgi:hypothetical protein
MKKTLYILSLAALTVICIPLISKAETVSGSATIDSNATISPSSNAAVSPTIKASPSIRNIIRTDIENRVQNLKANEEARKNQIDERIGIASSSRAMIKDTRIEARAELKIASSSQERKEIRKEMRRDIFNIERLRIAKQLELSVQNLKQVRDRINSRIQKEQQDGKDMSKAIVLLATADAKILAANTALQALKDLIPKPMTTAVSASTTVQANISSVQSVNLDAARQAVMAVQKAIKDAHRALTDVVVEIAHSMGLKLGNDGRDQASTTENR